MIMLNHNDIKMGRKIIVDLKKKDEKNKKYREK